MQNRIRKGLKPLIIKYMAMFMGICYLTNPLQQQVFDVLHMLSHQIESPNFLLSHQNNDQENYRMHHSFDHYDDELRHKHVLVDLVDMIISASNEDDHSNDSNFEIVKCDKHITSHKLSFDIHFKTLKNRGFSTFISPLKQGHLKKLKEPPQNSIC